MSRALLAELGSPKLGVPKLLILASLGGGNCCLLHELRPLMGALNLFPSMSVRSTQWASPLPSTPRASTLLSVSVKNILQGPVPRCGPRVLPPVLHQPPGVTRAP